MRSCAEWLATQPPCGRTSAAARILIASKGQRTSPRLQPVQGSASTSTANFVHRSVRNVSTCTGQAAIHRPQPVQWVMSAAGRGARAALTRVLRAGGGAAEAVGLSGNGIARICCTAVWPRRTRVTPLAQPRCCSRRRMRQAGWQEPHACRAVRGFSNGHGSWPQPMCRPPLQLKSAPVAKPDSSPASQATMEAISSGVPRRLMGMVAMILSSTSCRMAVTMSVPM
jgi:hypothetical protein